KIIKKRIENKPFAKSNTLLHVLIEDEYAEGHSLDFYLNKSIAKNKFDEFIAYFKIWLNFILNNGLNQANNENIYCSILKDKFIDSKPKNIIFKNGALILIDKEWEYKKACTVYSIIIRYLIEINFKFINNNIPGRKDPISKLFDYLKINYSNEIFEQYAVVEEDIANIVYDSCCNAINGDYPKQNKSKYNLIHKAKIVLNKIKNINTC
ncbi:MAG: hypothetical protein MUP02_05005, partial [Actinobacteria bacterium]|nr:hypothetical protein [Actinomycetota bacterium]